MADHAEAHKVIAHRHSIQLLWHQESNCID
uniref:Uncharacterized protein n=1 Tax=Anguilla anguilla TaxID=7936 RepID=A0A0E9VC53_ANGAN